MGFDRVPQPWISLNPTGHADAGIQSETIIIDSPGSYILTGNILGHAGQNGIEIHSGNVSLDLGGWSVRDVSGSLDGVISECSARNNGIDGIKASQSSVIVNSTSVFNGDDGSDAGSGSTIRNCTTDSNADHGIVMHASGMVIGSTAWANGNRGINASPGVSIENCNVAGNAATGINATTGSTIKNTISLANGAARVEDKTVSDNAGAGIRLT